MPYKNKEKRNKYIREKYHNDPIFRAKKLLEMKLWHKNNPEKSKIIMKRYYQSPKRQEYLSRPEVKERLKEYYKQPKWKEYKKKYAKDYYLRPEVKERYRQRYPRKECLHSCLECNKSFTGRNNKNFCSRKCGSKYWNRKHKESGLALKWQRNRRYRVKDDPKAKEQRRLQRKRHWKLHPERKPNSKGISKEAFDKMRVEYGFRCVICGRIEPFFDQFWPFLTQDYWLARSNGGRKRSKENIVPLCWNCNIEKGNKRFDIPKPLPIKLLSAPK